MIPSPVLVNSPPPAFHRHHRRRVPGTVLFSPDPHSLAIRTNHHYHHRDIRLESRLPTLTLSLYASVARRFNRERGRADGDAFLDETAAVVVAVRVEREC